MYVCLCVISASASVCSSLSLSHSLSLSLSSSSSIAMNPNRFLLKFLCFMSLLTRGMSASGRSRHIPQHVHHGAAPGPFMACRTTPYPQLCSHILLSSSAPPAAPLNRQIATVSSFALSLTSSSYQLARHLASVPAPRSAPHTYKGAIQDCIDLMSNTMDQLRVSISRLSALNTVHTSPYILRSQIMDAQVSLSASFTYQDTCSDELHQYNVAPAVAAQLLKQVADTSRAVTVALAMADTLHRHISP